MMKKNNNNISNDDSVTQLDKNLSRLVKLTDRSNKPGRKFTESLISGALGELKQLQLQKSGAKNVAVRSNWWEKTMGWAAMIAVACGAGMAFAVSVFFKMNLLLEIIVVLTMVFNWLDYLGGRI
jgi:anti-sigma-K factor RskA